MKKKISRIWGVSLALMMVVSLLMWTAPVAADTLEWDTEDPPEEFEAVDIEDMAVSEGGLVTYVVTGTTTMYASTDAGESWEDATVIEDPADPLTALSPIVCSVASDDPQYVAVAANNDATATANGTVYITEDGGATWDSLGFIETDFVVMDVAVSMESGDNRFVAAAGYDQTGPTAEVWYYEIGALGAAWTEITDGTYTGWVDTQEKAGAVAFSPNFNSDEILIVVTQDNALAGEDDNQAYREVFSFNTEDWNDSVGGFSGYPVNLDAEDANGMADLVTADIAPSPDYLGSDDDLRQVFVGVAGDATAADDSDGIFFCDDDDAEALEYGELIHSVDFDGTNLVAGAHDGTTVFYSADPLEGEDADVDNSSSSKSPGGEDECVVRFVNSTVIAGTVGDDSGISVSEDMGDTFNDITLIQGEIGTMLDFAISADGSVMYLLTSDNTTDDDVSLWRLDNDLWKRVRFFDDYNPNWGTTSDNLILRIAPDDPDVVFIAETGETTMFYSSDGGASKWHNRSSRYPINDVAVETTGEVLYVLTTNGYVSKSVNTGFTWGSKETSGQAGDYTLTSLGEDLLLIGGRAGADSVSYSTDGNEDWTDLDEIEETGNVQVCAEGLDEGNYLWAVTDAADSGIYWLELGEDDWEDDLGALTDGHMGRGIALVDGILYVLSENTTHSRLTRFLDPWGDSEGDESTAEIDEVFDAKPSALRTSTGSTNLWTVSAGAELFNYEDTVSHVGPTLKSPSNGYTVPMNEISGEPANVNLVWESPSDEIAQFEWEIAHDDGFDEGLDDGTVDNGFDEGDTVNELVSGTDFVPGTTYYWHVKVTAPIESPWSETRSFTVAEAEAPAPVTVEIPPQPEIKVEVPPAPTVTLPAPQVVIPPAPAPIAPAYIWGVIIIGAILVVALIVLILRTRRVV
jgi:hypothetical protein